MAVTQYIGARYVPKFYQNSDNTSDWRSGVIYEPLTIVTYNGNSYTSKIPVPASVGNPSANLEYWAPTGIYNEQVESLRQEFEELRSDTETAIEDLRSDTETAIEDLMPKEGFQRAVLLSDSYGINAITGGSSWIQKMIDKYPDRLGEHQAWGGAGFGYSPEETGYFATYFGNLRTDPDVDVVILLAGANDGNLVFLGRAVRQNIYTGLQAGLNILKTKYPNARIKIGFVGRYKTPNRFKAYKIARDVYRDFATYYDYEYIDNAEFALHSTALIEEADIHPNAQGSIELFKVAERAIMDIPYHAHWRWTVGTQTEVEINDDETTYTYIGANSYFAITPETLEITPIVDYVGLSGFGRVDSVFKPVDFVEGPEVCAFTNSSQATVTGAVAWSGTENGYLQFQALQINNSAARSTIATMLFPKIFKLKCDSMLC